MVHAGKRSQVPRGGWMPLRWAQPPSYSEDSSRPPWWLFVFAYLETRWQALSGSGGSSPGGVFVLRSGQRRLWKEGGGAAHAFESHANLAPPPCAKQSCMHHNLAQSPQSRDGGVRRWVGSMHAFEFRGCHGPVSRSAKKPRPLSFALLAPTTSRSPPFLRQLVARLNAGHRVGAGDVRHDLGPARGLGHGLVDAHLASVQPNPALFGCHGP